MDQEQWTAVERYLVDLVVQPDDALQAAIDAGVAAGLPPISVAPNEGKLLSLLARLVGAKNILEIGTLAGYSTIWLARALPANGRLITLESDATHAKVATSNIRHAGLSSAVEVRVGKALDLLPRIASDGIGPFDLTFIDADKPNIPAYFEWALTLSRVGSLIVVDNVIRDGAVIEAASVDPSIQGVRKLNEVLRSEGRVSATTIQTVGSKGYDGFTIALVNRV